MRSQAGFAPKSCPRSLLWALAWLLLAAWPSAAQDPSPLIDDITFEGNEAISDGDLRGAMRLRQPSALRPLARPRFPGADFLAGDLNEILLRYRDEGFPLAEIVEAVVVYEESGDRVDIHIVVREGPQVRLRSLEVRTEAERRRDLESKVSIDRGDVLAHEKLEQGEQALSDEFEELGHALVRVIREVRIEGDSADVVFRVDPGPEVYVDSIYVEPLTQTREKTVVRELTLEPGELLTPKRLLESRRRVLDSGVFRSVRIVPDVIDSLDGTAVIRVSARERKRYWVGGGAGYSSADQLRFLGEWGIRNISGLGRRLSWNGDLFYSLDPDFRGGGVSFQEGQLRLDYFEPRILRTRNRATFSTYLRWIQEESFHERIFGYSVAFLREISLNTRATVSLETREVSTTEEGVQPDYSTRFLRLGLTEDSRENPFDPDKGHVLFGQAEYAGGLLGGTNQFLRTIGGWQGYQSSEQGFIVATRIRGGFIEPVSSGVDTSDSLRVARIPWEERFRTGGSNTIRGYPENDVGRVNDLDEAIGGLALFLANVEVRFPIFWIIRGGVFLDMGNVWADPAEFKLSRFVDGLEQKDYNPLNVFYGAGGGLRFVTPVGPLRFDYGFKLGSGRAPGEPQGELHVALGQAF